MKEFEQGDESAMKFIQTLLDDINKACGNVWEFAVIDITDDVILNSVIMRIECVQAEIYKFYVFNSKISCFTPVVSVQCSF